MNVLCKVNSLWGDNLALDERAVITQELSQFLACPDTTLIFGIPVRLILNRYRINFHALLLHIFIIGVEELSPVLVA